MNKLFNHIESNHLAPFVYSKFTVNVDNLALIS